MKSQSNKTHCLPVINTIHIYNNCSRNVAQKWKAVKHGECAALLSFHHRSSLPFAVMSTDSTAPGC